MGEIRLQETIEVQNWWMNSPPTQNQDPHTSIP